MVKVHVSWASCCLLSEGTGFLLVYVVCGFFLNMYHCMGGFCIKGVVKVYVSWASCSLLSGGTGVLLLFSGVCF